MALASSRTPALAAVVLFAKAASVALRVFDGGAGGLLSPWAPLALVHQDLWLILGFGVVESILRGAAAHRRPRAGREATRVRRHRRSSGRPQRPARGRRGTQHRVGHPGIDGGPLPGPLRRRPRRDPEPDRPGAR